ncbi:MAG: TetR/AcrR family transcriptional regulator [Deltaproteobacteria bacterium]|nr:TetR/AcrR family transcriptional regulator [Deltaproteobacteria bacterium]
MANRLEQARKNPDSKKATILKAARRIFARRGYHATGIRDVAAEAGVDTKTLYYHWSSKQTLFEAVLADIQLDFENLLKYWINATQEMGFEQSIEMLIDKVIPAILDDPDAGRIVLLSMVDYGIEDAQWDIRYMPTLLATMRRYVERRLGIEALPPQFDTVVLGVVNMMIMLYGAKNYQMKVLGAETHEAYRERIKSMARFSIAAAMTVIGQGVASAPQHVPAIAP